MVGGPDGDMVVVEPEVDLVAWRDAELLSQFLGDHDLTLGTDAVSHTEQYNPRATRPSSAEAAHVDVQHQADGGEAGQR